MSAPCVARTMHDRQVRRRARRLGALDADGAYGPKSSYLPANRMRLCISGKGKHTSKDNATISEKANMLMWRSNGSGICGHPKRLKYAVKYTVTMSGRQKSSTTACHFSVLSVANAIEPCLVAGLRPGQVLPGHTRFCPALPYRPASAGSRRDLQGAGHYARPRTLPPPAGLCRDLQGTGHPVHNAHTRNAVDPVWGG